MENEREQKNEVDIRAYEVEELQKNNEKLLGDKEKLETEIREKKLKMSHLEEIIRRQDKELEEKRDEVKTLRLVINSSYPWKLKYTE